MIGLESLFGAIGTIGHGEYGIEGLIKILSIAPRKIFGFPIPAIKEGAAACLTLFNPGTTFIFDETMIASKSKNSAFIGKQLKGKVIGIINGRKTILNNHAEN